MPESFPDLRAKPLLIAGPCVIEGESATVELAEAIASLSVVRTKYQFFFKASYLKDNRSSSASYRGPGLDEGLAVLAKVKAAVGCPVLSDVHCRSEVQPAADVLDIIQIPAFLCRQTRLVEEAAATGKPINLKKGQFLSPEAAVLVVEKIRKAGGREVLVTERGTFFGYGDLVVDFRSIPKLRQAGCPVIMDLTHSLQKPASLGEVSGGEPELCGLMARAAAAAPCDGLFVETHFEPPSALSDAASMLPFSRLERVLGQAAEVFALLSEMKSRGESL